ncbi:MAG: HPr(Ser) kinase/phosphatase [bacterium]
MSSLRPKSIGVSKLIKDCSEFLHLRVLNESVSLEREVTRSEIAICGLVLAGLTPPPPEGQVQIIADPELTYLLSLPEEDFKVQVGRVANSQAPCLIIANCKERLGKISDLVKDFQIPVIATELGTSQVVQYLCSYLEVELAPEEIINGTLVDVYGVGILLRGPSGIGKSECALDLVERGHRLVADDVVRAIARPPGVLIGRSIEPLQNYVEVRGIGMIDIGSMFGIKALRRQKRIEVEVNLKHLDKRALEDRSGLDTGRTEILGITIPSVTVPLVPGKSISVIMEVIALSHTLRSYGYDPTRELGRRWVEQLRANTRTAFEPRDME